MNLGQPAFAKYDTCTGTTRYNTVDIAANVVVEEEEEGWGEGQGGQNSSVE
jgi:hypothetical protein